MESKNTEICDLEPKAVFQYFSEISEIPRPSYQEKAISDYLVAFAKEQGLTYYQDEMYNVIMIRNASAGYEDRPAIILQGHMDMVCEKTSDCKKDMEKEGPDVYVDGDFLRARGTTLGGDDGVAVAMMLALLSDKELSHPRMECVFTVSEEVGMDGARALDVSPLQGRMLLNIDSEREGELLASCAGGGTARLFYPIERAPMTDGECLLEISVTGGRGGHSGDEINKGRGNASILLGRVLRHISAKTGFRLVSVTGGSKDNAIPREAKAIVAVPTSAVDVIKAQAAESDEEIRGEFARTDAGLTVLVREVRAGDENVPAAWEPMKKESSDGYLCLLASLPNGIQTMSFAIDGLVETSLNLGIHYTKQEQIVIGYSLRSSVGSAYRALREQLTYVAEGYGCLVEMSGEYPAWEYQQNSPFREKLLAVYEEMTAKKMEVKAIHAGLECGLLSGKIPGLDAVSIGPDMFDVHTPDEHLSISSTRRVYEYVRKVIETI